MAKVSVTCKRHQWGGSWEDVVVEDDGVVKVAEEEGWAADREEAVRGGVDDEW